MIDYDAFCHIHHLHAHDGLNVSQIAHVLSLDARTVSHWLAQTHFRPRHSSARSSKLDPYKRTIRQLIENHPYSSPALSRRPISMFSRKGGVPFILSAPLNAGYAARAAKGGLNSYEIFDYAINGTA